LLGETRCRDVLRMLEDIGGRAGPAFGRRRRPPARLAPQVLPPDGLPAARRLSPALKVGGEVIGADQVLYVEGRRALRAAVDEGGLEPRKDTRNLTEVNIPDGAAVGAVLPLDVELGDDAVFDKGYTRLANVDADDEQIL